MKWRSFINNLKLLMLLIFMIAALSRRFGWFESFNTLDAVTLNEIEKLSVLFYGILYIIELRMTVKQKDKEIIHLKTQLNINSK